MIIKNYDEYERLILDKKTFIKLLYNIDEVENKEDCWIWYGNVSRGYAVFKTNSIRVTKALKIFYEITYGRIEGYIELKNKCNNKLCVNPYHCEILSYHKRIVECRNKKLLT